MYYAEACHAIARPIAAPLRLRATQLLWRAVGNTVAENRIFDHPQAPETNALPPNQLAGFASVQPTVVNGATSLGPNPARTRKLIWNLNHARKNSKVKSGLKNLAMLPSYFDYIFLYLRQKVRLRPELSTNFLSSLGPNTTRARPEKPGPDVLLWFNH